MTSPHADLGRLVRPPDPISLWRPPRLPRADLVIPAQRPEMPMLPRRVRQPTSAVDSSAAVAFPSMWTTGPDVLVRLHAALSALSPVQQAT